MRSSTVEVERIYEALGAGYSRLGIKELQRQTPDAARYDWRTVARQNQLAPPGDWLIWMLRAGRGFGKTRSAAEWCRGQIETHGRRRGALVGPTAPDIRDVMIEGQSGILNICPPWNRPVYEPSKRRLTWPNGAAMTCFSAEEPDRIRGPEHDFGWCEELATWKYLKETWDNLMLGMRLGQNPQVIVSTTPRPLAILKAIESEPTTVMTRGSTYDNLDNLAPTFRAQILQRYEGTRLGRQEIEGEIIDDVEGALWQRNWIDDHRVRVAPEMARIVVAIDPAVTSGEDADETGIAVVGKGVDGRFYVLDCQGYRLSPSGWANRALDLYDQYAADRIIAERNNGGEMVEATIRTARRNAPVKTIHASRGKTVRAEPIAALYEQGKVSHVGSFAALEDQCCAFPVASEHDDLVDALVYALTEVAAPVAYMRAS